MTSDDPTHQDLAARLARVEAVLAIQDLKARYAALVDARYVGGDVADDATLARLAEQVAALFTSDATWDGGPSLGVATGRDEIAARLRAPTLTFSRHVFASPIIDVEGDRATGQWELLAPMTTADGAPHWMSGVEHDTYRFVDGAWLHASMRLETTFVAPVTTGWTRIRR